jgi:hypothetical protein
MPNNQNQGFELQGYDGRLEINGVAFDAKTVKPKLKRTPARSDTTGDGAFECNRANKVSFSLSVSAFRYSSMNPHAAPFTIGVNEFVYVYYWPNRNDAGDPTKAWFCPFFMITDYSEDINAESGLQTIDIEGISSGKFSMPGPGTPALPFYPAPGRITDH